MTDWTGNELDKIGTAEELRIACLRQDGTLRNPLTIWVVRLGSDLYVRSANGRASGWFRAAQVRHQGHIQAGGIDKDVTFVDTGADIDAQLDQAYRAKYGHYAAEYFDPIVSAAARAATLRLVPR